MDELNALLWGLPGYGKITPEMKQRALDGAVVPDADGNWPGTPDYVPTYDPYFAALSLVGFLMAQPVVRQTSSEGTAVAVDAPAWQALSAYYRTMSPIIQATGGTAVLQRVVIPDLPYVVRTDMSGEGVVSGDVDTDLS